MAYISVHKALPLFPGRYKVVLEVGSVSTEIVEREIMYRPGHKGFMAGDWQQVHLWSFLPLTVEDARREGLL